MENSIFYHGFPVHVKREAVDMDSREPHIRCEGCGGTDFDSGDDGFFYCRDCGGQSQDMQETACADEDIFGDGGGAGALYSARFVRHSQSQSQPQSLSQFLSQPRTKASKEEIIRSLARNLDGYGVVKEEDKTHEFADEVYQPMDFGSVQSLDEKAVADAIRLRYVQGMQLMIQMQCKELVERFGVSSLICGVVGAVWLRYLAIVRVFDEDWANKAIHEAEAAARERCGGKEQYSLRKGGKSDSHTFSRRKPIYIWGNSLRRMIPIHSSLAITFLACHIAREPILPTDLVKWALEGNLPYISAFVEIDKSLGNPSTTCPLSSRFLFRPIRSVGSWQLEATAGSIAQCIGLHLPCVNFYAIAQRYLKQLFLPLEKILPQACRIFEWSMPAELWLSANAFRLPTRVCVMSILIVTVRLLYGIHGNGIWERSLSRLHNSSPSNQASDMGVSTSCQDSWKEDNHKEECEAIYFHERETHPSSEKVLIHSRPSQFDTMILLRNLEAEYNKMSVCLDYSKDFQIYLKYCKDIVFAGIATSFEEENLIERLWAIFVQQQVDDTAKETGLHDQGRKRLKNEDDAPTEEVTRQGDVSRKVPEVEPAAGNSVDSCDPKHTRCGEGRPDEPLKACESGSKRPNGGAPLDEHVGGGNPIPSKNAAVERMKLNMEENGFEYLPPRTRCRSSDYLHYRRKRIDGRLHFLAHADYYILLRACAKLAQVDARIMHLGVLKLERRLGWLEQRISDSLMPSRSELERTRKSE